MKPSKEIYKKYKELKEEFRSYYGEKSIHVALKTAFKLEAILDYLDKQYKINNKS